MQPFVAWMAALAVMAPGGAYAQATIAGCAVFPPDNVWNRRIDGLPVHPRNSDYLSTAGRGLPLHIDTSMPFNVVGSDQPMQRLAKIDAPAESDPGPFPIPANPIVEGGGGRCSHAHPADGCLPAL